MRVCNVSPLPPLAEGEGRGEGGVDDERCSRSEVVEWFIRRKYSRQNSRPVYAGHPLTQPSPPLGGEGFFGAGGGSLGVGSNG